MLMNMDREKKSAISKVFASDDVISEISARQAVCKSHVLLINTGGTLSMERDQESGRYIPKANFLENYIRTHPSFTCRSIPQFDVLEYSPLLDSSDVTSKDWIRLGADIKKNYSSYDGFVVVHGTDTLAYTATALSFELCNLGKPVLVTGAQIPIQEAVNDAVQNLAGSLYVAGTLDVCEVCVFFHNRLMRGNRVTKIDNWGVSEAFASPAIPPLGRMGLDFELNPSLLRPPPKGALRVSGKFCNDVAVLHMVPGFSDAIVENMLKPPLRGVVLRTYGSGNIPKKRLLLETVANAVRRDVVIVVVSQCVRGRVDLHRYEASRGLLEAGAISGYDLTVEAAAVKLSYLLAKGMDSSLVKAAMQKNLRGELSPTRFRDMPQLSKL